MDERRKQRKMKAGAWTIGERDAKCPRLRIVSCFVTPSNGRHKDVISCHFSGFKVAGCDSAMDMHILLNRKASGLARNGNHPSGAIQEAVLCDNTHFLRQRW